MSERKQIFLIASDQIINTGRLTQEFIWKSTAELVDELKRASRNFGFLFSLDEKKESWQYLICSMKGIKSDQGLLKVENNENQKTLIEKLLQMGNCVLLVNRQDAKTLITFCQEFSDLDVFCHENDGVLSSSYPRFKKLFA